MLLYGDKAQAIVGQGIFLVRGHTPPKGTLGIDEFSCFQISHPQVVQALVVGWIQLRRPLEKFNRLVLVAPLQRQVREARENPGVSYAVSDPVLIELHRRPSLS